MVLANNHRLLPQINLTDDRILIHNLEIVGKDAVDYLQRVPEEERDRNRRPNPANSDDIKAHYKHQQASHGSTSERQCN
jgi:hypothetical protein